VRVAASEEFRNILGGPKRLLRKVQAHPVAREAQTLSLFGRPVKSFGGVEDQEGPGGGLSPADSPGCPPERGIHTVILTANPTKSAKDRDSTRGDNNDLRHN